MYEKLIERLRTYTNDGTDDLRNKAADAIERLADENTRLVTTANGLSRMYDKLVDEMPDGWIHVARRLPEKTGEYLVSGRWGQRPNEVWVASFVSIGTAKGWSNPASRPCVTYWMPLPEPPKEDEA